MCFKAKTFLKEEEEKGNVDWVQREKRGTVVKVCHLYQVERAKKPIIVLITENRVVSVGSLHLISLSLCVCSFFAGRWCGSARVCFIIARRKAFILLKSIFWKQRLQVNKPTLSINVKTTTHHHKNLKFMIKHYPVVRLVVCWAHGLSHSLAFPTINWTRNAADTESTKNNVYIFYGLLGFVDDNTSNTSHTVGIR